jgi:AcrR family transcriptional regulator
MATRAGSTPRMSAVERREQLLDATKAIVDRCGFHAVSIEAVAREAGITRPVVYGHFDDLNALLEALVERESARALGQLKDVPTDLAVGDPRDQLLAGLNSYLRTAEADPVTWKLVLMPPEGAPDVLREAIARGRAAIVAQLAEAVRPGLGQGRPSPDPELTALTFSSLADDAARLLLTQPDAYPVERIMVHAEWLLAQLLAG